jgi:cytochrome c oxidase cbb3-type subunit 3
MRPRNVLIAVVLLGLVGAGAFVGMRSSRAATARFLMASPDSIPNDPALLRHGLALGKPAYAENCAGCHGDKLQGDSRKGIPNLADGDWLYGSGRIGELERIVMYGIRSGHSKTQNLAAMPAFATANPYPRYKIDPLNPAEVDDVATLLYSFQHPTADPAAVARGSSIYHGKGLCFDCHADHAKGDAAIGAPNLTDNIWLYGDGSMASIRSAITRGLAGICPAWESRLAPDTMRAIAVYVHSFQ